MAMRNFILDNLGWKMASVVVAILIWITINSNIKLPGTRASSSIPFKLPIAVVRAASDLGAFRILPGQAEVTVRGESAVLNDLNASDLLLFVDLTHVKDDKNLRKKIIVHTPPNVAAVKVDPEEVEVTRIPPAESANSRSHQD